jgi:hypothetical protein
MDIVKRETRLQTKEYRANYAADAGGHLFIGDGKLQICKRKPLGLNRFDPVKPADCWKVRAGLI